MKRLKKMLSVLQTAFLRDPDDIMPVTLEGGDSSNLIPDIGRALLKRQSRVQAFYLPFYCHRLYNVPFCLCRRQRAAEQHNPSSSLLQPYRAGVVPQPFRRCCPSYC